ncbi:MAG: hypothetical protein HUJ67_06975 [Ruminiclostridium sp.]|nr:hypothetical protein [Ruminiclostridium sp.]
MEPDKKTRETPTVDSPLLEKKQEVWEPADRPTRIKAWIGIAAMVLLTVGYFYVFYSGQIINW